MSQLTDNLNLIVSIKSDIKTAIENKGVDMTGVSFGSFADKIGDITTSFVTVPLSVSVNGTYTPGQGVDGYSQVVVDVPQSGAGFTEKEITEGVQIVNLNNSASYVHPYVFEKDTYLQTVNLLNCISVGSEAFKDCTNLTTVNLPNCYHLYSNVFQGCTSLTSISLPLLFHISGAGVFSTCRSLSEVSFPVIIELGASTFNGDTNLRTLTLCTETYTIPTFNSRFFVNTSFLTNGAIYVPSELYSKWIISSGWSSVSSLFVSIEHSEPILSYSSGYITGITKYMSYNFLTYLGITKSDVIDVSLDNLIYIESTYREHIASGVFDNCNNLKTINIQNCRHIGSCAFRSTILSNVSLPVCEYIGNYAFAYINVSLSLTLGYSDIVSLGGSSLFMNTNNYTVYVPSSLVDAYKSAEYWSAYSSRIFPISE